MRKFHPLTELIPMVADREQLAIEIAQSGHPREHIVIYEKLILEGRVRALACRDIGIYPQERDWVMLPDAGDDPLDWMVRTHVAQHNPSELDRIKLAVAVLPHYRQKKGQTERLLHKSVGLSWNKIRTLGWLEETGNLDKVLSGEKGIFEAGRELGLVSERRRVALGTGFGKGDKFDEATQPLLRYLNAWKRKGYEFRHLNPAESKRRLELLTRISEEIKAASVDLTSRSHEARLSMPAERRSMNDERPS